MAKEKDQNQLVTIPVKRSRRKTLKQIMLDLNIDTYDELMAYFAEKEGY